MYVSRYRGVCTCVEALFILKLIIFSATNIRQNNIETSRKHGWKGGKKII